jgi:hypothetical protein
LVKKNTSHLVKCQSNPTAVLLQVALVLRLPEAIEHERQPLQYNSNACILHLSLFDGNTYEPKNQNCEIANIPSI